MLPRSPSGLVVTRWRRAGSNVVVRGGGDLPKNVQGDRGLAYVVWPSRHRVVCPPGPGRQRVVDLRSVLGEAHLHQGLECPSSPGVHVALSVRSRNRSRAWYQSLLGFQVIDENREETLTSGSSCIPPTGWCCASSSTRPTGGALRPGPHWRRSPGTEGRCPQGAGRMDRVVRRERRGPLPPRRSTLRVGPVLQGPRWHPARDVLPPGHP